MHFVNDVDLEPSPAGPNVDVAAELADFVDAAVARAVDFDHIHIAAAGDALTDVTDAAGSRRRAIHAVQRFGEDAGSRSLANAASAGEQIGVTDAIGRDRVGQSLRDLILADKLAEILGAIAAGDDDVFACSLICSLDVVCHAARKLQITSTK